MDFHEGEVMNDWRDQDILTIFSAYPDDVFTMKKLLELYNAEEENKPFVQKKDRISHPTIRIALKSLLEKGLIHQLAITEKISAYQLGNDD